MAEIKKRDVEDSFDRFVPEIESEVLKNTRIIMTKKSRGSITPFVYEIYQRAHGRIEIPRKDLIKFAKELIEIDEMCNENWNAEMFRR